MGAPPDDLYELLGVSPAATTAELRRAYRRLALEHHPDRAGPASAPRFARIAEAYRMRADPTARSAYDAHRLERGGGGRATSVGYAAGGWSVGRNGWSASWRRAIVDLLSRVSGPLDALVAAGVAAIDRNGVLELRLLAAEAASGGTAVITMPLAVACPTCGGVARPGGVWCVRCDHAGEVTVPVSVQIRIPEGVRAGATTIGISDVGGHPPPVRLTIAT